MPRKKTPKPDELLQKHKKDFETAYETRLDEDTGQLYNQFIAFISEARVPLYNALVVLEIVRTEVVEQIRKRQGLI